MANELGRWAFIVGALLAVILGIGAGLGQAWGTNIWLLLLLLVIGLVIGLVNITQKEVQPFLVSAIALFAAAAAANLGRADILLSPLGFSSLGSILQSVINYVVLVVGPAALVVALREVYVFAQED